MAQGQPGACTPTQKPRQQPLSQEEQQERTLAQRRVRVEPVIRRFQRFRRFSGR